MSLRQTGQPVNTIAADVGSSVDVLISVSDTDGGSYTFTLTSASSSAAGTIDGCTIDSSSTSSVHVRACEYHPPSSVPVDLGAVTLVVDETYIGSDSDARVAMALNLGKQGSCYGCMICLCALYTVH